MENTTLNRSYQDDGIDLYDLWLILKKKKTMIFIIVIAALLLSMTYASLSPKVYRVSNTMIINQIYYKDEVEFIMEGDIIAAVTNLEMLLSLNKEMAAQLLSMQVNDLDEIQNIKASEIKGSKMMRVDIGTYDKTVGIALMEALPRYIQSTPIIANKLNMRVEVMAKSREDLEAIINNPMREMKLPSIDLFILREKYNHMIMMIEKIKKGELVSLAWKTEPPATHYGPKMSTSIILGFVLGLFLGIVVALFMEWSDNARRTRGFK